MRKIHKLLIVLTLAFLITSIFKADVMYLLPTIIFMIIGYVIEKKYINNL